MAFGRRHRWVQVLIVASVLPVLAQTDHNGDGVARLIIWLLAVSAAAYALIHLWRGDRPTLL